jgi:hypothetical protein
MGADDVLDTGYTGDEGQQGADGQNPAWQPFLEAIPQESHEKVIPLLKTWDNGVNERFNKVHSEYEPWKPIIQASGDPDTARFALNLLQTMQSDPEVIYNALKEKYKFDSTTKVTDTGQGQGEPNGQDDPYAERFAQQENQLRTMAEIMMAERQAKLNEQADQVLDRELSTLEQKYGKFNEEYVLAMIQNGYSTEDSVKKFFEFQSSLAKQYSPKPLIMGGGGGAPGQNFNPAKMSDSQINEFVVAQLAAAAAERKR